MRTVSRAGLAIVLVPGMLVLPTISAPAAEPRPIAPQVQTIDVRGVDSGAVQGLQDEGARGATAPEEAPELLTAPTTTEPFDLVGVTWPAGETVQQVQVRVREDGAWSGWEELEGLDEGPDPGTEEYAAARLGTSPLSTNRADGVQVRVDTESGAAPRDVKVSLVDPGTSAADGTAAGQADPAASADAANTSPRIVTRRQWGADERLASTTRVNGTVKALTLHHTAGSNSYTQAQAPAQLRGIYAYHTQSLGWSDVGYNLVIDRYGTIYEGRRGSITAAVQGAHAGGFNRDTFGVSVMGNFASASAPSGVTTALNKVIGWKLGQYGANPRGTSVLISAGGGTSKYPAGRAVTVNNVMAHRDVGNTSCPGSLYLLLPSLRTAAAPLAARTTPNRVDAFPKDVNGDRRSDVLVVNPSGRLVSYAGRGDGRLRAGVTIGQGWGTRDLAANVGDWSGDGWPDLMAREPASGDLYVYHGTASGYVGPRLVGTSWTDVNLLLGVGDADRDGDRDLLTRRKSDGALWLYRGNGAGGFVTGPPTRVSKSMAAFDQIVSVGDLDDEGDPDLVVRNRMSGRLFLMAGTSQGTLQNAVQIGAGWSVFSAVVGVGNMDGAGGVDVLARGTSGVLTMYRGTTSGTLGAPIQVGHGWSGLRFIQ